MNRKRHIIIAALLVVFTAAFLIVSLLYVQGRQRPSRNAEYVALGSSFAAGLGLGPRVPGSPIVCQRSTNGYPQQFVRMTGLSLADMSCSGATVSHVLRGGQMFLGPQIEALGPQTRLVTLTAGGNDIGYVADLTAMAYRRRGGVIGFLVDLFWTGARPAAERKFEALKADMLVVLGEIRRRAPKAQVIVVTYPVILPSEETCPGLGIDNDEAELMRQVAAQLADVTRQAAKEAGATVVDMDRLSTGHDACSPEPWVNGARPADGAPFHPTLAGARATAERINTAFEKTD